ncbi:MAG: acetyl-CoA carboxylase biotin carboxylase subunit [Pusillimonas sp.]
MNTNEISVPAPVQRSIKKVLVANRGEIAVRIMRSARAMGIDTVAVYSAADREAAHVAFADQAVCVGEAPPVQSYLNMDTLLRAAEMTGADAVHPGYGFLSENAEFARACARAGLVFVGPPAHAIEVMGDKSQAKQFMRGAGLPCIPGYDGEVQDVAALAEQAQRIGYPVIIKATAGGGGRGMRVVGSADGFAQALESARSEARNAFGDDRMLVEKVVCEPRHIEIQVLVDRYGNGVHFGERDCSVQRRHQKVIEEAPAPNVASDLRDRLGEVAVAAAVKLGYEGVGTFEFLLEGQHSFYFMEMNTRLQVEHPVTEAITGEDLVGWQFRVAMGEPILLRQQDIKFEGHAIEVRLCAEDERRDFMPQSGRIETWLPPADIRVDHAVISGWEISPYYDSMFAKLIAYGKDREEARRKLVKSLRDTVVFGIHTNRQALIRFLEHPAFMAGGVDTGFLQRYQHELAVPEPGHDPVALALAAMVLCRGEAWQSRGMVLLYLRDDMGMTHEVRVTPAAAKDSYAIECPAGTQTLQWRARPRKSAAFGLDGVERPFHWLLVDETVHVQYEGRAASFTDLTYAAAESNQEERVDGRIRATSNGRVVSLLVAEGDDVEQGAPLLTVEAMKMEYTHQAPFAGKVNVVHVAAGDSVMAGRMLLEIQPLAAL